MAHDVEGLEAARLAAREAVGLHADRWRGVPGVLLGAGPSLTPIMDALAAALREGRGIAFAPASLGAALGRRGVPALVDGRDSNRRSLVDRALILRALGCDPLVLAGLDLAWSDGLSCGGDHERVTEWAVELNPFRTIEDLQARDVAAHARSQDERASTMLVDDRRGRPVSTTRAMDETRAALERLIERDAAVGLRTFDLDAAGVAKRGAVRESIDEALSTLEPIDPAEVASVAALLAAAAEAPRREEDAGEGATDVDVRTSSRVAAVIACDPERGGTGVPRHLDSEFAGRSVLAMTLERVGRVQGVDRIILLVPEGFDPHPLFDPRRVALPVEIDACGAGPFPSDQSAIRTARLWSDTSWRGGINGASIWDEVVAPAATFAALERRGLDGALLCGADWPLLMIEGLGGADDLVERFRAARGALDLTYAPAPPGIGGAVVGRALLAALAQRRGPALVGERIDAFVRTDDDPSAHAPVDRIRRSMVRAALDSMRAKLRLRRAIEPILLERSAAEELGAWTAVTALEHQFFHLPPAFAPQHLVLELNTGRRASGSVSPHRLGSIQRPPMTERLLERILEEIEAPRDVVITFGYAGDPLWHPELPRFIELARRAGARAVHVRTELVADEPRIAAMLDAAPDVISVDLHAESAGTYAALVGFPHMERVLGNLEMVLAARGAGDPRFLRPFVVPRIQRRRESLAELAPFVERWRTRAGAAVIEGAPFVAGGPRLDFLEGAEPIVDGADPDGERILPAPPPPESVRRESLRRMVILSDGRVPASELDLLGERTIGSVQRAGVFEVWRELSARRRQRARELERVTAGAADGSARDEDALEVDLRWWQP